uniref:Xylanolytic transcriptional activator regulatory domain-containing protein n=1 Tax=Bionectria ochroleuca TaxID=29856 RepID=A0A8H7N8K4_BIOOC
MPACVRCSNVDNDCVYPESRRKRIYKRTNVKEMEEQLARLEEQLNLHIVNGEKSWGTTGTKPAPDPQPKEMGTIIDAQGFELPNSESGYDWASDGQLIGLGVLEPLPPFEVMEELHGIYFRNQHHSMPILHPALYLQAIHGPPNKRPPMCLQYIVWATASKGNEKYDFYADAFYKRARQYINVDEMQGDGDHLTLRHLQAYIIMAGFEAKCMLFTRASMSSAKSVSLVHSLGFDRVDDPDLSPASTTVSSTGWIDIEQQRRAFWGAFAIDSHASISTGWASLIYTNDFMTRLPASEDAFLFGQKEDAPFLDEVFTGACHSAFATTLVICHIFKITLNHTSRHSYGAAFWKRHKDLDHKISSIFMFLPERFQLPDYKSNPVAAHTNLNLHATTICLHYAAVEMVDKHSHPEGTKRQSLGRMRISAEEIVEIIKTISPNSFIYKSVLCALSLYCAASVYIYFARDSPAKGLPASELANFEMILRSMETTGHDHKITRALLLQVYRDVERYGLSSILHLPDTGQVTEVDLGYCPSVFMSVKIAMIRQPIISPLQVGRLPLGAGELAFQDFTDNTLENPLDLPDTSTHTEGSTSTGKQIQDVSMPSWPQSGNDLSSQMLESMTDYDYALNDGFESELI